ncbi:hypothetical protein ACIO3O_39730 [Streptomyces sp. NPDC087440]|uniref:hypothetical protein n=1 Tax=Streptomyces sp. NPDC087440 TaxID=3365790 RepID=UPI00382EFB88
MVRKRAAMAAAGAVLTLTVVSTGAATGAATAAPVTSAPVAAVAADEPDPLPNFVGRNLFRVYSTVSAETALKIRDLSGEHRKVLWPPNWKVCTQSPKAGTKLRGGTLELGVVKTDEKCPKR